MYTMLLIRNSLRNDHITFVIYPILLHHILFSVTNLQFQFSFGCEALVNFVVVGLSLNNANNGMMICRK